MTDESAGSAGPPKRTRTPRTSPPSTPKPRTRASRARRPAAGSPATDASNTAVDRAPLPEPGPPPPLVRRGTPASLPPLEEVIGAAAPARARATADESGGASLAADSMTARLASAEELADWDRHTVTGRHGHVYQSRAWGEYRAAHGRPVWHIVFGDGFRMLVVGRERPVVGGGWAYAPRGPIPEEQVELSAARATVAADLIATRGMDTFTVDGETPSETGLGRLLGERGFEPVEEVQTSRHRMDVALGPEDTHNSDEETIFASFSATTRNNIRQAERRGLRVVRLDAGGGRAEADHDGGTNGVAEDIRHVALEDAVRADKLLRTFYVMLDATAERRGFALASEAAFLDWSNRALAAGHLFYLQAEHEIDGPVAGATFYRHGHRLTYSLAGDRAELRKAHPGAVRLLVWRGIQIALDERRSSVDLGGVDTEGARGRPEKGDPTYGMYQFKESFGARWVDLTGAHQRTLRPMHNLAGRVLGKLASLRR